jgi:hypothetical protein
MQPPQPNKQLLPMFWTLARLDPKNGSNFNHCLRSLCVHSLVVKGKAVSKVKPIGLRVNGLLNCTNFRRLTQLTTLGKVMQLIVSLKSLFHFSSRVILQSFDDHVHTVLQCFLYHCNEQ